MPEGAYHPPFTPAMSLADARDALRDRVDKGESCPCCTQLVRVYRRPLTSVAARALIALYRDHGRSFGYLPDVARTHLSDSAHQGGTLSLAHCWGLIEEERAALGDNGRAGWWRVTELGEQFILERASVPSHARIFNGRVLSLVGDPIGIRSALGKHFNRTELLGLHAPLADDGRSDDALQEAA